MRFFRSILFLIVAATFGFAPKFVAAQTEERGDVLHYNRPVTLTSMQYPKSNFWCYFNGPFIQGLPASSIAILGTIEDKAPWGDDKKYRPRDGAQLFVIKPEGDNSTNNTGPIEYGDKIEIFSIARTYDLHTNKHHQVDLNSDAAGEQGGKLVASMGRYSWEGHIHQHIGVFNSEIPAWAKKNEIFTLKSHDKLTGEIHQNDNIQITCNSGYGNESKQERILWAHPHKNHPFLLKIFVSTGDPAYTRSGRPDRRFEEFGKFKFVEVDPDHLNESAKKIYNQALKKEWFEEPPKEETLEEDIEGLEAKIAKIDAELKPLEEKKKELEAKQDKLETTFEKELREKLKALGVDDAKQEAKKQIKAKKEKKKIQKKQRKLKKKKKKRKKKRKLKRKKKKKKKKKKKQKRKKKKKKKKNRKKRRKKRRKKNKKKNRKIKKGDKDKEDKDQKEDDKKEDKEEEKKDETQEDNKPEETTEAEDKK